MKTFKDTKYGDLTGQTYYADIDVKEIETLEGAPKIVKGKFICGWTALKSLEGAPEECDAFNCAGCKKLEDLTGAPKIVKVDFSCAHCDNLKSLKGSPKTVEGYFECVGCNTLKDLKGAPKFVKGEFKCDNCESLESLEGAPEECGTFECTRAIIKSVEGAPKKCTVFDCRACKSLKNLDPLLKCDIEYVNADSKLLKDYEKKKKIVDKHGYEKAMAVLDMLDSLA